MDFYFILYGHVKVLVLVVYSIRAIEFHNTFFFKKKNRPKAV